MAGLSTLARLQIALGLDSAEVARGATTVKGVMTGVKADVDAAQASLNRGFNAAAKSANTFGDALEINKGKVREWRQAGRELVDVASAISPQFGAAAQGVQQFTQLSGDVLLLGHAAQSLGPAFASSAASAVGLGTSAAQAAAGTAGLGAASAAATPEVTALGAAANTAAAGGIGTLASVLGALAAPIAAVAAVGGSFILFEQVANSEAAKTNETLNKQSFAASDLGQNLGLAGGGLSGFSQGTDESTRTAGNFTGALHDMDGALGIVKDGLTGVQEIVHRGSAYWQQFTTDAKDSQTGLDNVDRAARALRDTLDGLPASKTIDVTLNLNINGAKGVGTASDFAADQLGSSLGFAAPSQSGASDLISSLKGQQADIKAAQDKARQEAEAHARAAAQAAAEAKRKAEQDARELAQAQIDAGNEAFDRISKAAHDYFDKLHAANLAAIEDAQKAADARIEAEKRANQQAVTDLEKAQQARLDARRLGQLQSDLEAAQAETGVDPAQKAQDIQDAQNALSDFLVQQAIDQKQAQADAANATLDQQKADQDAQFNQQRDAENNRHQAQLTAFDEALSDLRKYLSKHPAEWAKATQAVMATLKAAGADYKAAGAANATAYLDGVRAAFGGPTSNGATPASGRTFSAGPSIASSDIGSVGRLAEGLVNVGGGAIGDVYLDAAKVGEVMDRRQGTLSATYGATGVSTGSAR